MVGTPYYLSPEICEGNAYSKGSDVWSLGCVLYELVTLSHAFDGKTLPALVLKILSGHFPPIPSHYSSSLHALISSMLQLDPDARPSIEAILELPFLQRHISNTPYLRNIPGAVNPAVIAKLGPEKAEEKSSPGSGEKSSTGIPRYTTDFLWSGDSLNSPLSPDEDDSVSMDTDDTVPKKTLANTLAMARTVRAQLNPSLANVSKQNNAEPIPTPAADPGGKKGSLGMTTWMRGVGGEIDDLMGDLNAMRDSSEVPAYAPPASYAASPGSAGVMATQDILGALRGQDRERAEPLQPSRARQGSNGSYSTPQNKNRRPRVSSSPRTRERLGSNAGSARKAPQTNHRTPAGGRPPQVPGSGKKGGNGNGNGNGGNNPYYVDKAMVYIHNIYIFVSISPLSNQLSSHAQLIDELFLSFVFVQSYTNFFLCVTPVCALVLSGQSHGGEAGS